MLPSRFPRDSIGEAITIDTAVDIQSPNPKSSAHSRNASESHHLLQSPRHQSNHFEYSSTAPFRYPDGPKRDERKLPEWAGVPQPLTRGKRKLWRALVVDGLLVIMVAPFFLLAAEILRLDGEKVDSHQLNILHQCIWVAATLLPLCFSLIVGRATLKLASFKLERGTTIGLLERLVGSRTVSGTFITQFQLWPVTFLGIGLILLWSLSPFGSQAALRMLSVSTATKTLVSSSADISYTNSRQATASGDEKSEDTWFLGFASLFSASLLAPAAVKSGPTDLWGNVKIPLFSSLLEFSEDLNGWRKVPETNYTPTYSSLYGIPISGLPLGSTTFNTESTYLELSCSNVTSIVTRTSPAFQNTSTGYKFVNPGLISTIGPFRSGVNVTDETEWAIGYLGEDVTPLLPNTSNPNPTMCLDCLPSNTTTRSFVPGVLLYQDFEGVHNVTNIYCGTSQVYVESAVSCTKTTTSQSCAVTAQRFSVLPSIPSSLTYLSFRSVLNRLSSLLPQAVQKPGGIDIMQNYIYSPLDNTFIQSTQMPRYSTLNTSVVSTPESESRFLSLPVKDFSIRLSQIINTYLQGSGLNSTSYLTGSALSTSSTSILRTPSALASSIQSNAPILTVPTNATLPEQIYKVSYPWLSIYLLTTTTLLLSALLATILHHLTLFPGYLDSISSLLRESPGFSMPRGGVGVSGVERTRGVAGWGVRLGDLGDVGVGVSVGTGVAVKVGRVGIGDWGSDGERWDGREKGIGRGKWGGVNVGRLVRGKLYL